MPLNKLENFIKNTDGRTLYVNPADLNATDSITNQGTSLTEPFRTIQRALLESARFSYVRGNDNDLIERTTIVVYPGEHPIDNRPGYGIKTIAGNPVAELPDGSIADPFQSFNLTDDSNFDIESPDNVLWRFNSIHGGVIIPRGTSIVGMDLRKTKIRPLYVPNPVDPEVPDSAIFRVTGTCYFWQFTIFDGSENGLVFTDNKNFTEDRRSVPTFSHHKLTAFEYADGVNPAVANGFDLTDLQIYYSKLSNAYNEASGRPIDEKYPLDGEGFAPQRPEFEIVGAFATDPVRISRIISGDGFTPDAIITVDTTVPHELSVGTPIKIRGVAVNDYNVSTKVASILSPNRFTYSLFFVRPNLPAEPSVSSANVTVETDTVTGASPYIFNVSMRSVWGINGMHADGSKATGFRSMVVAQFTAISLQKDDRAFVKYNQQARRYDGITLPALGGDIPRGSRLSAESASTDTASVYHLDPEAVYRPGWDTTHIKMSNDAVIQIVSVFAIGFNQHFGALSGADASITNSNSNFGQFALLSDGFKNDAFDKDDQGFITQVITPNNAFNPETNRREVIDYVNIDFDLTRSVGYSNHLYLKAFGNPEDKPPTVTQGFRIGGNYDEQILQPISEVDGLPVSAQVRMVDGTFGTGQSFGAQVGRKSYTVLSGPIGNTLTLAPLGQGFGGHGLQNGEKIRIFSAVGDLPENIEEATLYYANVIDDENIRISSSESNALNNISLGIFGGTQLRIESRVNDKEAGDFGHPLQFDDRPTVRNWYLHVNANNEIWQYLNSGQGAPGNAGENDGDDFVSQFIRKSDNRSLDDKLYRLRYVIPKESQNAKPPTAGYVLQSSSTTGARNNDDFIATSLDISDYGYARNNRFIVSCNVNGLDVVVRSEKPHQLSVGDKINIINVESVDNPDALSTIGYNGEFIVTRIDNARQFRYSITDVNGFTRTPGLFINNTNDRNILLPRFQRKDNRINGFVYRIEKITDFVEGIRDGIYHLFIVNASNKVTETFTDRTYNQPIEDLYPQLDIDNVNDNPTASATFANRAPLGRTTIDEPQNSITRETLDKITKARNASVIVGTTTSGPGIGNTYTETIGFDREHEFNGVYSYTTLRGGSGYSNGTFYNVRLINASNGLWYGASCKVVVVANSVSQLDITDPGSGYKPGDTLVVDGATLGGGVGGEIDLTINDIEDAVNTVVQVTGGGSLFPDTYSYITDVPDDTSVTIVRSTTSSSGITSGMYVLPTDSGTPLSSYSYDPATLTSTFVSQNNIGFGLQRGNSFVLFDSTGSYIGKYYVASVPDPNTMLAVTEEDLGDVAFVGKCGYEDNDASTGFIGENIGVRGFSNYDNGTFYLEADSATGSEIRVRAKDGGITGSIPDKLYLGRYLQINSEILRVSSTTFGGPNQNIVSVIRGALGTNISNHPVNSKVRTIQPEAVELRRPSILRASGHTFEYLGYGPGNYSTALPQLQVRQLPDDEVYLVQSQELAAGQVVYTGMSDNGDFYIGNTKYSATSGTQITFDIPIPTVAGEQAASNSVVFDEVIINRRLFVAGGETNEVLSQFDGPVKFTNSVTIQARLSVSDTISANLVEINNTLNSTAPTNGALKVRGGVGIERDLYIGGDTYCNNYLTARVDEDMGLFMNQQNGDIFIGGTAADDNVIFRTTKLATGEGGDLVGSADAGVKINGGLVVLDKVIAKEFDGDGLGAGPGSIVMWGGDTSNLPKKYLLCNGQSVSRTANNGQYAKLFDAIGYTHGGSGDTFRVPDLRQRFIVGAGGDNPSVSLGSYSIAQTGGANSVTLTANQIPTHNHTITTTAITHSHNANTSVASGNANHSHGGNASGGAHAHSGNTNNTGSHSHSGGTNNTGSHAHGYSRARDNSTEYGNRNNNAMQSGLTGATTGAAGSHSHNFNTNAAGSHSHNFNTSNVGHNHGLSINAANASHGHGANTSVASNTTNHTHTLGNFGGDASHENRPPFMALCYIIQFK